MTENTEFVIAGTAEAAAEIVVGTSAEPVGALTEPEQDTTDTDTDTD